MCVCVRVQSWVRCCLVETRVVILFMSRVSILGSKDTLLLLVAPPARDSCPHVSM